MSLPSIPWVAALLADSSFVSAALPSRTPKPSGEDSFFAKAINSPSTISAALLQHQVSSSPSSSIDQIRIFFTLGSDLNGYPGTLHGGVIAALLDETMGLLLAARGDVTDATTREDAGGPGTAPVTASLNTTFLRPVNTPGTIVVYARLTDVSPDRRKWKIQSEIKDGTGRALARGECLYVRVKARL